MSLVQIRRHAAPLSLVVLIPFLATFLPPRKASADVAPGVGAVGTGTGGPASLAGPAPAPNTPEQLATVDLSTGAAQSFYPFRLNRARGDAQPSLSLVYNSSAGIGVAGPGWSLDLPSIVRRGKAGHPRFDDSVFLSAGTLAADTLSDDYFVDGELLVPICTLAVSGISGSCTNGAAPTETLPAQFQGTSTANWVYFRREIDDGARYFLSADGRTWAKQTKSGHLIQYGHPLDGLFTDGLEQIDTNTLRMKLSSAPYPSPVNPVFRWDIVRDTDASTNSVYYTWTNLSGILPNVSTINPGLLYLSDIYDTAAVNIFAHHVHLTWLPSPAAGIGFLLDPIWRAHPAAFLSTVDVTSAPQSGVTRNLVRRYHLGYQNVGPRLFLSSITLEGAPPTGSATPSSCGNTPIPEGSNGTLPVNTGCNAMPSTTFTYYPDFVSGGTFALAQDTTKTAALAGLSQVVPPNLAPLQMMDINGDGAADVVTWDAVNNQVLDARFSGSSTTNKLTLNPGNQYSDTQFTGNVEQNLQALTNLQPKNLVTPALTPTEPSALGDWAGDGRINWLLLDQNTSTSEVYTVATTGPSGGSLWVDAHSPGALPNPLQASPNWFNAGYSGGFTGVNANSMDVDGDGLTDMMFVPASAGSLSTYFTARDRTGATLPFQLASNTLCATPSMQATGDDTFETMADVDGDGVADMLIVSKDPNYGNGNHIINLSTLINRGDGRFGAPGAAAGGCDGTYGYSLVATLDLGQAFSGNTGVLPNRLDQTVTRFGDLNGDGFADLVMLTRTGMGVCLGQSGSHAFNSVVCTSVTATQLGWAANTAVPTSTVSLALGDMDGGGMQDIVVFPGQQGGPAPTVWSVSQNQTRPGLLKTVTSSTGATTTLQYESVHQQGIPSLQVPAWTVTSATTSNGLTGSQARSLTHSYQYETPIYDARERVFLGFQQVADNVSGPVMPVGTQQTTMTFATTACAPTPGALTPSCPLGADYSNTHGMRGLPVSILQSAPGANLRSKWNEYRWYPLYSGMDGRVIVQRTLYQEHDSVWDSSQANTLSNVFFLDTYSGGSFSKGQGPSVSLPIPNTPEKRHQYNYDSLGNLSSELDYGYLGMIPADQIIATLNEWQLPPGDATGWNYRVLDSKTFEADPSQTVPTPRSGTNIREYQYAHDASGRVTDVAGILSGGLPLPGPDGTPGSRPAAQPPALPGIVHVRGIQYDTFGNVSKITEPNPDGSAGGACTAITYDTTFDHVPVLVATYANGCSDSNPPMQVELSFDRGFEQVIQESAPHLSSAPPEIERRDFDAFGRIAHVYRQAPDPSQIGMTEATPALAVSYSDNGPIRQVHAVTMDGPTASPYFVDHYGYLDAFGDKLAAIDRSGPTGGSGNAQWTVSGYHTRFSTGAVDTVYQPFFLNSSTTPASFNPDTYLAPRIIRAFSYDGLGRLTSSGDFQGATTFYTPGPTSDTIKDPEQLSGGLHPGAYTTVTHDGHGRVIQTQRHLIDGPASDVYVTTAYQATGEPLSITRSGVGQGGSSGGSVTRAMQYDSLGRMVRNVEPNTSKTLSSGIQMAWTYAYDALGRLVGTSDARGCGENLFHDNFGRLIAEDYSPCTVAQALYLQAPNLSTGDYTEAFYVYDAWNRLLTEQDLGQESTYLYDTRDRVTGIIRQIATPTPSPVVSGRYAPNLFEKTWVYTEADRPSQTAHINSTFPVSAQYTWDGRIQSVGSSNGVLLTSQTFDASGRPMQQVFGDAAATTVDMTYDGNERLSTYFAHRAAGAGGRWFSGFGYSPPGAADPYPLETQLTNLTIHYDGNGNPVQELDTASSTFTPPWPTGSSPASSRSMQYFSDYRLARTLTTYAVANDPFVSPYQAEAAHGDPTFPQPAPVATRPAVQTSTYDWDGNTSATGDDLYDFYDRSLETVSNGATSTAGGPNQLSGAVGNSPGQSLTTAYDNAGNMTSLQVSRTAGQSSYSYAWDEVGRLASATRSDAGSGFQITDTFAYAADGHRVRTSRQSTTSPLRHTLEVFDSLVDKNANTVGTSYQDDSTTEQIYLGIGGITLGHLLNDPLDPNGTTHVLLEIGDPLASTSFVIDHDTGELVEHPTYTPNGAADSDYREPTRWDSFREDVRYTGHRDNAEVGLIYFGARYYNPQLGRWISPDPLAIHGLAGDPNPYAFVGGSPMGNVDLFGLAPEGGGSGSSGGDGNNGSPGANVSKNCLLFGLCVVSVPNKGVEICTDSTSCAPIEQDVNDFVNCPFGLCHVHIDLSGGPASTAAPSPPPAIDNSIGPVGPGAGSLPSGALRGIGDPILPGQQCTSEQCEETFPILYPLGDLLSAAGALSEWLAAGGASLSRLFGFGQAAEGASAATLEAIAQGRSLQGAVQALNQTGATQAQAIRALTQVTMNSGREFARASLAGAPGTVVLTGVQFQLGGTTAAIAISPTGVATFGSGVAGIVDGVLTISQFVPK